MKSSFCSFLLLVIKATQALLSSSLPISLHLQKQPPDVFCKKRCLKKFSKICRKHLCQSLFFKACVRYFLSNFYFQANDSPSKTEKCFLFHLKSSFCPQNILIFVFLSSPLFLPVSHCIRGCLKINIKVYDVINCLNKNLITHSV